MANLLCAYGDSGDGKTSLFGSLCQYVFDHYPGKKVRLCTADNTEVLEPYMDAGILDVWRVDLWDHPFETLDHACQGYWPQDPTDPKSKLVPPTPKVWEDIKAYGFEGMRWFGDLLMFNLAEKMGDNTRIGPGTRPLEDGISFKDGTYGVGGNARIHYALVQKEIYKLTRSTDRLPVQCMWTTHVIRAAEDNKPIFGPQIVGNAATSKVQSWFGSLVHCHTVPKQKEVDYRLYLKEHYDPNVSATVPYKAVTRVPLPLLDKTMAKAIGAKWDAIIPEFLEWTSDSKIMERYMGLRKQLREAAKQLIIGGQK